MATDWKKIAQAGQYIGAGLRDVGASYRGEESDYLAKQQELEQRQEKYDADERFRQWQMKQEEAKAPMNEARTAYWTSIANQANARASQLSAMQGMAGGMGVQSPQFSQGLLDQASQMSGQPKEDFYLKPVVRSFQGVPTQMMVPDLKPMLPSDARKILNELNPVRLGTKQNLDYLEKNPEIQKFMTPLDWKAYRSGSLLGGLGQLAIKLDPSKDVRAFSIFKAETDKLFQKFRKETTGAQAAMRELGWLAPDFPETTDNPALYKAKATEALKRIEEGYDALLKHYSSMGYRTSQVRNELLGQSMDIPATGILSGKSSSTNKTSNAISDDQFAEAMKKAGL